MSKVAVVFWSQTGNTEAMANAVAEGATGAGADAVLINASDFSADAAAEYDAIAFGCPSMGVEVLEEAEFQPMWDEVKGSLAGKKIALFGSYGWGDGEWMRNWSDDADQAGAIQVADYVICNDAPDEEAAAACERLGSFLK